MRYLVVGGVAVVLHGLLRFTAELYLVVDFEKGNLERALGAFKSLGYQPRAPVAIETFADDEQRKSWVVDKGMVVFSLWNPQSADKVVDLFAEQPFNFDEAFKSSLTATLGNTFVTIASIDDLIQLKQRANRPQDISDIAALRILKGEA